MSKRGRGSNLRPRKERDFFSLADGRCIIDLSLLAGVLETAAVCSKCTKGILRLKIDEKKKGFVSKLLMECSNVFCGDTVRTGSEFFSSKRLTADNRSAFEVNRRMVLMAREIGCGHAALEKLSAVIQRNAGNVGLLRVLEAMNITDNTATRCALEKLDALKETRLAKKMTPEVQKRRQILRGLHKKRQDHQEQTEDISYASGAFGFGDLDNTDKPGPSEVSKKKHPRKRKVTSKQTATQLSARKKPKQQKCPTQDDSGDDSDHETGDSVEIQPTRRSTRIRHTTQWICIDDYVYGDDDDDDDDDAD